MKKLLMLTAFMCSVMLSSVTHAEWTKVGIIKSGKTHYVDLERMRKHDGKIYFWELFNPWELAWKDTPYSYLTYIEAGCGVFRSRALSITRYEAFMTKGNPENTDNKPSDWD